MKVDDLKSLLKHASFDTGRLDILHAWKREGNILTSQQLASIMGVMTFDLARVQALRILHPLIKDPENLLVCARCFQHDSSRKALTDLICSPEDQPPPDPPTDIIPDLSPVPLPGTLVVEKEGVRIAVSDGSQVRGVVINGKKLRLTPTGKQEAPERPPKKEDYNSHVGLLFALLGLLMAAGAFCGFLWWYFQSA